MRILVIHERNRPHGGGEQYLEETCAGLRGRGCKVFVVSREGEGEGYFSSDASWTVPDAIGLRTGLSVWPRYAEILAAAHPDVIYVNGAAPYFLSPLILGRLARARPVVIFVHHIVAVCPSGKKCLPDLSVCTHPVGLQCCLNGCVGRLRGSRRDQVKWFLLVRWWLQMAKRSRCVVCPSGYVADEVRRNGFPDTRVRVLPLFTSMVSGRPIQLPRERRILWIGRFDGTKGFDTFLRVLSLLRSSDWVATVVGGDAGRSVAEVESQRAGVGRRTQFVGRLDRGEMARTYTDARLLAVTSPNAETFGISGIEAMAHGRPVVAVARGGVGEWLSDGQTGFLVPPGDLAALAERIDTLLLDDALWLRMASAGIAAVDARFRPESHMAGLLAILERAAAERPVTSGVGA